MTHNGVRSVLDVQHGEEHVEDLFPKGGVGHTGDLLPRRLGLEGESDGLGDGEGGQVVVVFLVVDDLTKGQPGPCY